jgi:ParB family chromosome partitioning protein
MEQARAFDRLGREFNMTQEQISIRTGKDRASIGNFLRLLKLPPIVQDLVESGQLSFGHARALLALEGLGDISDIARKIMQLSLSVRQTEQHIQDLLRPKEPKKESKPEPVIDPNVRDAQERLQRVLGLKVTIEDRNGRGRVIIEYARLEDFDTLLEQLGKS